MNELTIVIPTIGYTRYLDQAIESCFKIKSIKLNIHVNVNSTSEDFEKSLYWNDKRVIWRYTEKFFPSQRESINNAVENAKGDWLFILSDDDYILEDFFQNIDLKEFSRNTLYATRINIIDEFDVIQKENPEYEKSKYTKEEALSLFFKSRIQNHLSLFVFHRSMFEKIGKLVFTGYPNGYYIDTVLHGKALANCDYLYTANKVVFSRRESSSQGSAKFYFDKEVNNYFDIIINAFFEDENFKKEALKRYGKKKYFYKRMIQDRFYTEWSKLNKPVYNKSLKKKLEFFYKHLVYWKTGGKFKIFSFFYVIFFGLNQYISPSLRNKIKKILGR